MACARRITRRSNLLHKCRAAQRSCGRPDTEAGRFAGGTSTPMKKPKKTMMYWLMRMIW